MLENMPLKFFFFLLINTFLYLFKTCAFFVSSVRNLGSYRLATNSLRVIDVDDFFFVLLSGSEVCKIL